MECILCKSKLSINNKKCKNGTICSQCYNSLPDILKKDLKDINVAHLKNIIININKKQPLYVKLFTETSSCGSLHIDDLHGLFAICKSKLKNGKLPLTCKDIFNVLDINNASIYLKTIETSSHSVKCAVYFTAEMVNPDFKIDEIIKHSVSCYTKNVDSEHYTWIEPYDIQMFRNIFNKMWQETARKYNERLKYVFLNHKELEIYNAKQLFMIGENYSENDIKEIGNKLLKAFKTNNKKNDKTQQIKRAYNVLLNNLKEKGEC